MADEDDARFGALVDAVVTDLGALVDHVVDKLLPAAVVEVWLAETIHVALYHRTGPRSLRCDHARDCAPHQLNRPRRKVRNGI